MISKDINLAISILQQEGIIGFPTETVYGLAGNIFSEKAVKQIYEIKQRPKFNPLIAHLKGIDQLETVASHVPIKAYQLAEAFWPGPLTLVLEKQHHVPDWITAGKSTVALRVPAHPMALELLSNLDFPLAAPSANPFSTVSPTTAVHVENYFGDQLALVLDGGECQRGIESTIIGFENQQPVLYRHGSIPIEEIESVIGPLMVKDQNNETPEAPGMLFKHYSPTTKFIMVDQIELFLDKRTEQKIGIITLNRILEHPAVITCIPLSLQANLMEAAANLYSTMHQLDGLGLDLIIAEQMPDNGLGRSINDRMKRASYHYKSAI